MVKTHKTIEDSESAPHMQFRIKGGMIKAMEAAT